MYHDWRRKLEILFYSLWGDPGILEDIHAGRPPFNAETTERFIRANSLEMCIRFENLL